jgi:ectoine hydroxylase-related dioxygenase (phytanoyl-CoA dioxygenase family)
MAEFNFPALDGLSEAYEKDGYAIIRQVLAADFVAELENHIKWLREKHPELATEALGHWLIARDPFWVRFVSDPRLLDVAEQIVGPNVAFMSADYICKAPGTGRSVTWHQDANYWPLAPMDVVTFWFAVSDSGPHNGGVKVVPGSHKAGLMRHVSTDGDPMNVLGAKIDPELLDESKAVDLILRPGDISIHHPYTLHGSEPNTSEVWRNGGSIQYMPATTRIMDDAWPSLFFFRGTPVEGVNAYLEKPDYVEGEHMAFAGCENWNQG